MDLSTPVRSPANSLRIIYLNVKYCPCVFLASRRRGAQFKELGGRRWARRVIASPGKSIRWGWTALAGASPGVEITIGGHGSPHSRGTPILRRPLRLTPASFDNAPL